MDEVTFSCLAVSGYVHAWYVYPSWSSLFLDALQVNGSSCEAERRITAGHGTRRDEVKRFIFMERVGDESRKCGD